ncbi:MAG: zinc ribbon domain-containing protein [Propionibacteriaceae bacterium]
MPAYAYRCCDCGPFDVVRPITEPDSGQSCPACGQGASRVFTVPAVRQVAPGLARALGAQERSAHEPSVVSDVPAARRAPRPPRDPRQARLPRP